MRILHVITKLELGGAQQNTLFTCRRLAEAGHEVVLAHGTGGLLDGECDGTRFGCEPIPELVREIAPIRDVRALRRLAALMKRLRPDVVHTHSSKAGVLGRLAARLAGIDAVVHTAHGWSFSERQPRTTRLLYRGLERAVAPLTRHVISVSERDLATGHRLGLVRPGCGSVIRSGIDLAAFSPDGGGRAELRAEWGVRDDDVLVANVSCLKAQKAPVDFVRAAGLAARQEPSLRFVLVGDGVERAAVERTALEEGLGTKLVLAGWRRDVEDVLRAADVVALTSLWEGLPRVVVQARATGRPVVATRVNGTPEAVEDGRTGLLVEPGDVPAMAAALVRLARDQSLRARLGAAGRLGLDEFDQELMVRRQAVLYESLLRRRDAAPEAREGERLERGARSARA